MPGLTSKKKKKKTMDVVRMKKEHNARKANKHTLKPFVTLCVMWVTSCRLTQKECLKAFSLSKKKCK